MAAPSGVSATSWYRFSTCRSTPWMLMADMVQFVRFWWRPMQTKYGYTTPAAFLE
nr:hypothetical protein [Microbacterium hominis]